MNKHTFLFLLFNFFSLLLTSKAAQAAVILQYHHVSDSTPKSTSISPKQFQVHMQYLKDNGFNVIPVSEVVNAIKSQQSLPDKSVAITFDDAYLNILENAKPILDSFNYPFTIFVNPALVRLRSKQFLSWQQLKAMADEGVIIANHGYDHHSVARKPNDVSIDSWLKEQTELLTKSEALIKKHTGQSWQYFAYPYGEYTPEVQSWLRDLGYIAFSQQSGAVGLHTDLTNIPRFPASQPYDKISGLRDKLRSLAFNITLAKGAADNDSYQNTVVHHKAINSVTFNVEVDDFYQKQLNCYISGLGKQQIDWLSKSQFSITFNGTLPVGRVRSNCTVPSKSKPGRYYWFSKPWFVLKPDGSWFHP